MRYARLLAKSSHSPDAPREPETLLGHLRAVTSVASLLAGRWGDSYLASLGLDPERFGPRLRLGLPRAAFAHDLGKANDHFQRAVRAGPGPPVQAGWHEQLSVWLLLTCEPLGRWLFEGCDSSVRQAILVAVLGHHLRAADQRDLDLRAGSGALHLVLLTGHPDFAAALKVGTGLLALDDPPALGDAAIDLIDPEAYNLPLFQWWSEAARWWRSAYSDERRFVAALKALIIAADVAGSALPRHGVDSAGWVASALSRNCTGDELSVIVERRLKGATPRPFQEAVAASPARVTFVRAGCGSGKTVAAYLWAARRGRGRKLFFCYPTTGTASQGYADYTPPDEFEAALVHSRAAADLEDILSNSEADEDRLAWLSRFTALVTWDAPITVCTVDTVLGLIQNNRSGLFGFAPIAAGAFVFDEVHQYDDRLFGALLRFVEAFRGVPMLLMTASLPRPRFDALRRTIEGLGERLEVIDGPADLEALKRYRVTRSSAEDAWDHATATVRGAGRVLWVSNTVRRAVSVAREAEAKGLPVLPYHSRYRYMDRLKRHANVIHAFTMESGRSVVAVTTQVCEVSLDISTDLLVTDLAPIPALIQRLGRLNRRVTGGSAVRAARGLVVEPLRPEPYRPIELEHARGWLELLGEAPCAQADLATAFERLVGKTAAAGPSTRSAWLDDGVLSTYSALREEGATIPVIREEDTVRLRGLPTDRRWREVIRLTIPMPLGPVAREVGGWGRERGAFVAPSGRLIYEERLGGRWR